MRFGFGVITFGLAGVLTLLAWTDVRAQTSQVGPAPAASSTLPTIGRSRSQRYCTLETDRTNGAVTVAVTNDKIISAAIARLRSADLDKPELTIIEREKSMRSLREVASAIQTNVRAGDAQVADLRALSRKEPDATRSPELKVLAEHFDDVFVKQRSVGADLAKMLTIIDGRFARSQGAVTAGALMPQELQDHVRNGLPSIDQRAAYEPLNALFNDVAGEFDGRLADIGKSEDAAAGNTAKAVAGC